MEYKGKIVYDVYTIIGTCQLNVEYEIEGSGEEYEVTRIVISQHDRSKDFVSFNLEDEMEDILEACIKDFTIQKSFMPLGEFTEIKADLIDMSKPKLANDKFDFSAN
jgi:hypothetical protein